LASLLLGVCALSLVVGLLQVSKPDDAAPGAKEAPRASRQAEDDGDFSTLAGSRLLRGNHLALINITGPIMMEEGEQGPSSLFSSDSMAMAARKALDKAAKDDAVKGVLIRIDSPGGTVAMSQELNAAVTRVRNKKPVVASLGDIAASGGYYTACAADKIVANPGTLTGSIGVILSTLNFRQLLSEKLGVQPVVIKSGRYKDILSPYRQLGEDERKLLQDMIDTSYQQFLNAVLTGRTRQAGTPQEKKALASRIRAVADGRVLVATDAVKQGLVDEIGDLHAAKQLLDKMAKSRFRLAGDEDLPLLESGAGRNLWDWLNLAQTAAARHSATSSPASWLHQSLPVSMRYPNQPLWIKE
jgi:protease-4